MWELVWPMGKCFLFRAPAQHGEFLSREHNDKSLPIPNRLAMNKLLVLNLPRLRPRRAEESCEIWRGRCNTRYLVWPRGATHETAWRATNRATAGIRHFWFLGGNEEGTTCTGHDRCHRCARSHSRTQRHGQGDHRQDDSLFFSLREGTVSEDQLSGHS